MDEAEATRRREAVRRTRQGPGCAKREGNDMQRMDGTPALERAVAKVTSTLGMEITATSEAASDHQIENAYRTETERYARAILDLNTEFVRRQDQLAEPSSTTHGRNRRTWRVRACGARHYARCEKAGDAFPPLASPATTFGRIKMSKSDTRGRVVRSFFKGKTDRAGSFHTAGGVLYSYKPAAGHAFRRPRRGVARLGRKTLGNDKPTSGSCADGH
jgi:hypothetical protein